MQALWQALLYYKYQIGVCVYAGYVIRYMLTVRVVVVSLLLPECALSKISILLPRAFSHSKLTLQFHQIITSCYILKMVSFCSKITKFGLTCCIYIFTLPRGRSSLNTKHVGCTNKQHNLFYVCGLFLIGAKQRVT